MNIVSAVANMQKELDYYKEQFLECKAVLKQLVDGPGEIEYIHPYDFHELANAASNCIIDLWKIVPDLSDVYTNTPTGKKYKVSVYAPVKSKSVT